MWVYFARMRGRLGGVFRPEDTFASTLLGMVEALDSGITTVVDWSHNLNGPDYADAAWDALQRGGGRALFAHGARACGLDDRIGTLEPGKQVDVADTADGHAEPGTDERPGRCGRALSGHVQRGLGLRGR